MDRLDTFDHSYQISKKNNYDVIAGKKTIKLLLNIINRKEVCDVLIMKIFVSKLVIGGQHTYLRNLMSIKTLVFYYFYFLII